MKKILFIILIVNLLFSISKKEVWATASNLRCIPTTGTYKVGETFTVDYVLDTRSFPTYGANVVATFDSAVLEAIGATSTPVTATTGWGVPVTNTIDATLGKITLDWGNTQPAFTGNTTIGKITFKARAEGQAQFNYIFFQQYDDTTPGVAVVWGKKDGVTLSNILTDVNNCIYVVEAASVVPTSPPVVNPTVPPVTELPLAGGEQVTVSLLGLAIFLILSGSLLSPLLLKRE